MRLFPLLPAMLLALPCCTLQERLDKVSGKLEAQFDCIKSWEQLPERTISWNQAVAMMKRNNPEYINTLSSISRAERSELSVYTDLIPGLSYYSFFSKSLGDITSDLNSSDMAHNVNVTFYIPSLTQVPYRVYATKVTTFAAIKALEGKERELISKLYVQQRKQNLNIRQKALDSQKPDVRSELQLKKKNEEVSDWMELAQLLGDYSARWHILPASVPEFKWSKYRNLTGKLDPLIVCKLALDLEQARMSQYSIALNYLPTINLNLYSPSLFSSTGGTYSGTFLDTDDTTLNLSLSYTLDTKLRTWNNYQDSKVTYELRKRETSAKLVDLRHKLKALRTSMEDYYTWRSFMLKRMEHLRSTPAINAAEFLENENSLHSMQKELLNQESAVIESEAALILQYGLR